MKRKLKKAINRTGKQVCPICQERHILVEHHIRGRKIPKPNHPSNLCYICDNCHRLIHEGQIILEGYFQTTAGQELLWHTPDEESLSGDDAKPHIIG